MKNSRYSIIFQTSYIAISSPATTAQWALNYQEKEKNERKEILI